MGNVSLEFNQASWQEAFFASLDDPVEKNEKKQEIYSLWNIAQIDPSLFQQGLSRHQHQKVIAEAKKVLIVGIPEIEKSSEFAIAFTGSDGREEKLSTKASPIEIIVVVRKNIDLHSPTIKKIQSIVALHRDLFFSEIEVKCLETDSLINFNPNVDSSGKKEERPIPTRAFDARHLIGSQSLFGEYKHAFYNELCDHKSVKALRAFKKDSVGASFRLFRRLIEGADKSHIDLLKGRIFYDGNRIRGVKYPFLRTIQYKLAMHVFTLVQDKKISELEFSGMPCSTIERIQWLADKNLLKANPAEVKTFQRAYAASLIWSGISQLNHEGFCQKETTLPVSELKEVVGAVTQFCSKLAD